MLTKMKLFIQWKMKSKFNKWNHFSKIESRWALGCYAACNRWIYHFNSFRIQFSLFILSIEPKIKFIGIAFDARELCDYNYRKENQCVMKINQILIVLTCWSKTKSWLKLAYSFIHILIVSTVSEWDHHININSDFDLAFKLNGTIHHCDRRLCLFLYALLVYVVTRSTDIRLNVEITIVR